MTVLYKLAREQLSKQYHYDFGLRALKSVLVMAGELKRGSSDLREVGAAFWNILWFQLVHVHLLCAFREVMGTVWYHLKCLSLSSRFPQRSGLTSASYLLYHLLCNYT